MAVVEVLADVAARDRPGELASAVVRDRADRRSAGPAARDAADRGHVRGRRGLRRGDRRTAGTRKDQHLADHERRVRELVGRDDVLRIDVVRRGDRCKRVRCADRDDEAIDRRDHELLADVQRVLGVELVRPPDRHHRDAHLAGDPGQGVTGADDVRSKLVAAVGDGRVDDDGLEERPVLEELARHAGRGVAACGDARRALVHPDAAGAAGVADGPGTVVRAGRRVGAGQAVVRAGRRVGGAGQAVVRAARATDDEARRAAGGRGGTGRRSDEAGRGGQRRDEKEYRDEDRDHALRRVEVQESPGPECRTGRRQAVTR